MGSNNSQEWYLEINGKTHGPYTWQKIKEFLTASQIQAATKITSPQLRNRWTTVGELLSSAEETDPAISLFDTLQLAKERTSTQLKRPPGPGESPAAPSPFITSPPRDSLAVFRPMLFAGIGALLLAIWGIWSLMKSNPEATSPQATTQQPSVKENGSQESHAADESQHSAQAPHNPLTAPQFKSPGSNSPLRHAPVTTLGHGSSNPAPPQPAPEPPKPEPKSETKPEENNNDSRAADDARDDAKSAEGSGSNAAPSGDQGQANPPATKENAPAQNGEETPANPPPAANVTE